MGVDSQTSLRWGFIGCGNIANDFVNALKGMTSETPKLSACAARSLESAQTFANTHRFDRAYGAYEELCADPEVDVVYIATIHLLHFEHITLALNHGKHVLAEKPLTMNAKQTTSVVELAKTKQLFLLEGVWTRFFPFLKYVRQIIDEGQIGDVQHVYGDIGFPFVNSENEANFRSSSGDGTLIGAGIYPLSFVTMVFGTNPVKITATGKLSSGGADIYGSATLEYSNNRFGTINFTVLASLGTVTITGSKGKIHVPLPAHHATEVTVTQFLDNGTLQSKTTQFPLPKPSPDIAKPFKYPRSEALVYEAESVTKAIRSGKLQCDEYTTEESVAIAKIMDEIRNAIGVEYAADVTV
ncbi:Dimeric dihydrodiol dehydrogenase [Phytophthora megakarya]|uniref:D-xylose 1-dehydrogenase (NADP(+), D-xylono-1,5-lactone-forming) n=1 Tax=Phytophthora megakarya TaxID=4795 RepID=A0A225V9G5_9STRA|nr:Dimeric dihydrodiol dehydrogenase [Phytophthora megakarya]